jgi:hypothetical protein
VHQYRGSSSDVVFGLALNALVITNEVADAGVVLSEVLTQNTALAEADGSTPDWIELHNPSTNDLDLAGLALSDDPALARKWIFPVGSVIRPGGYFAVASDASKPPSTTNTGFGLKAGGGAVFLHGQEAGADVLLDSNGCESRAAERVACERMAGEPAQ